MKTLREYLTEKILVSDAKTVLGSVKFFPHEAFSMGFVKSPRMEVF